MEKPKRIVLTNSFLVFFIIHFILGSTFSGYSTFRRRRVTLQQYVPMANILRTLFKT